MSSAEDHFILRLREGQQEGWTINEQQKECMQFLAGYHALARKASWAYNHYLRVTGNHPDSDPSSFIEQYLQSWCDFLLNAATGHTLRDIKEPPLNYNHQLLIGWHCPEYPLWLPYASRHDILVLIARPDTWMSKIVGGKHLYFFRAQKLSSTLPRAFREGKPVFAMMDYCYNETVSINADFLGYPAKTPAGLLYLAQRYKYEIVFLTMRGRLGIAKDCFPADSYQIEECAVRINKLIENEILRQPARWLLWPSVDNRWIGVNYAA
jgi:hypothetical protein